MSIAKNNNIFGHRNDNNNIFHVMMYTVIFTLYFSTIICYIICIYVISS